MTHAFVGVLHQQNTLKAHTNFCYLKYTRCGKGYHAGRIIHRAIRSCHWCSHPTILTAMKNRDIPIKKYFNVLCYDFIETYSFNRGAKFENKFIGNNLHVSGLIPVLNTVKQLNDTANKISVIKKDSVEHDELSRIISKQFVEKMDWMCAPFYRDALVFRTKDNQIVESLNVCFECGHMCDILGNHIEADEEVYNELKFLLKSLGHEIQDNEYLQLMEKINAIRKLC
jgi:hypothetical protein